MLNTILYAITVILLLLSFFKDKDKTKKAVKKAVKAFENILPDFMGIIMILGLILAVINPLLIAKLIGDTSGVFGVAISSTIGAITLIPGFIAFPLSSLLLEGGAGYAQIGAFVSSLMMVGVITLPVEVKYFGKRLTFVRNLFAFGFSFIVAVIIGMVVG